MKAQLANVYLPSWKIAVKGKNAKQVWIKNVIPHPAGEVVAAHLQMRPTDDAV